MIEDKQIKELIIPEMNLDSILYNSKEFSKSPCEITGGYSVHRCTSMICMRCALFSPENLTEYLKTLRVKGLL